MVKRKQKESSLTIEERLEAALVPEDEQPYEVPENWYWVQIGQITDVVSGGTPSTAHEEYYKNGDIPWISPADLSNYSELYISHGAKNITQTGLEKSSARLLPIHTVCLSTRAPIGYVVIAGTELCTNQGFKSFLPSKAYLPEYLYWYLKGIKERLEDKASGTTFLELSGRKAAQIEFPIAPLPEQHRIVSRIESLFSQLDEARDKAQEALDGFEERKKAILHKAFLGELTGSWRIANHKNISSWQKTTIGNIADVKGGKRVPKGMSLVEENTGHPYIKAGNLKQGTVIDDGMMYVPNDVLKYIKNYTVETGDVYITNVGACIGDCGVIPSKYNGANLTENAVKITNLKGCNSDFMALYLSSDLVQGLIKQLIASATLGKLSIANIKTIPVDLPTGDEQEEIVRILNHEMNKERIVYEYLTELIKKIDILRKSILAKAFRGELGTNDPDDENAIELIKRILKEQEC